MELTITRYGVKISVKDGMFEMSWFDENKNLQKEAYSPKVLKSLWIQEGSSITVSAHLLALQHGIDLVLLDDFGMPQARFAGFEINTTPSVQKAQVMVSVGPQALEFVKSWIAKKLNNQAEFLEKLKSRRDSGKQNLLDKQAKEILKLRKQVLLLEGKTVRDVADTMRGLEGAGSQVYFQTLSDLLPDEYQFNGRSKMPAKDPFNAFLNYGLAILYSKTEKWLLLAGVNPYIGFLHRDGYRLKSMVFDFIEPYRVWVERVVFRLFSRKMVTSSHTTAQNGGLFLNPIGKKLLSENLKEYFDEKKEEVEGALFSREQYLHLMATRFARRLMQVVPPEDADDGLKRLSATNA
jgi:CRISPR-associated protein Cas1